MNQLTMTPDYLRRLIVKVRALMLAEVASGPLDDDVIADDELTDETEYVAVDLSREEVIEEIEGLGRTKQSELVALMWIGRGDAAPQEWADVLALAEDRREVPTVDYLLDQPLLADYWAEGLERLGYEGVIDGKAEV